MIDSSFQHAMHICTLQRKIIKFLCMQLNEFLFVPVFRVIYIETRTNAQCDITFYTTIGSKFLGYFSTIVTQFCAFNISKVTRNTCPGWMLSLTGNYYLQCVKGNVSQVNVLDGACFSVLLISKAEAVVYTPSSFQ